MGTLHKLIYGRCPLYRHWLHRHSRLQFLLFPNVYLKKCAGCNSISPDFSAPKICNENFASKISFIQRIDLLCLFFLLIIVKVNRCRPPEPSHHHLEKLLRRHHHPCQASHAIADLFLSFISPFVAHLHAVVRHGQPDLVLSPALLDAFFFDILPCQVEEANGNERSDFFCQGRACECRVTISKLLEAPLAHWPPAASLEGVNDVNDRSSCRMRVH